MAAICTRHTSFVTKHVQLLTSCTRRSLSSKNTYYRKYKHRRNPKISELNVEDILYGKTSATAGSVVVSIDDTTASKTKFTQTGQETNNGSWYHSKERLKSLKTTEKIVAGIAVITMLLGYFGIKWMVSVPPSQKIEQQEPESTATVQQPTTH